MIVKFLGVFDLIAALWIVLAQNHLIIARLGVIIIAYLLIKCYIFRDNWVSYIDLLIGVYIVFVMGGSTHALLSYLFAIYLGQKALFSLFA
jgi:hypothetical protein